MALFGRTRTVVPAELRRRFASHERIVAVGDTSSGRPVVATQQGLWWPEPDGDWRLIGWNTVVHATWQDSSLLVTEGVTDDDGIVEDLPAHGLELTEPRNLPQVVRDRVEASIARTEQVTVPGGTARIVARRVPGRDGVVWTARLDASTPASPEAHEVLAEYRRRFVEAAAAGTS